MARLLLTVLFCSVVYADVPYGVAMVNAPLVWPTTKGRSLLPTIPINVVVIGSGIDYRNDFLRNAYRGGHDFVGDTDMPLDNTGDGSLAAGIIAAAPLASMIGVAPEVELWGLKIVGECGVGKRENLEQAIHWVINEKQLHGGNWIILVTTSYATPLAGEEKAFDDAKSEGIVVFAGVGNIGSGDPVFGSITPVEKYPGAYASVVSVGAVDEQGIATAWSETSAHLTFAAPGVAITSRVEGQVSFVNQSTSAAFATDDERLFFCAPPQSITATYQYCKQGAIGDFPAAVRDKIALVQRGALFVDMARNASGAGARAVIVINLSGELSGNYTFGPLTSDEARHIVPLTVVSQDFGSALLDDPSAVVTVGSHLFLRSQGGTQFAAAFAAGSMALAWAVAPLQPAPVVLDALNRTATDRGNSGRDDTYGYGIVNAYAAAQALNPLIFKPAGRRRAVRH